jgi:hypothetical protein
MDAREEAILTAADIARDGEALTCAALDGDLNEARFRATLILDKASAVGLCEVMATAARVLERLGPMGGQPHAGYGDAILQLASAIDVLWFDRR